MFSSNTDKDFDRRKAFIKQSLFVKKKWFIPYNLYNNHWILIIVHLQDHIISIYDSLIIRPTRYFSEDLLTILDKIRGFLYEYGWKHGRMDFCRIPWIAITIPLREMQPSDAECGLYVCKIAELCSLYPDQMIVNIGIRCHNMITEVLAQELVILTKQLSVRNLVLSTGKPRDIQQRGIFLFDFQALDSSSFVCESVCFNMLFTPSHGKFLSNGQIVDNLYGKCGVYLHVLADPTLSYMREIDNKCPTQGDTQYMLLLLKKKKQGRAINNVVWNEARFDFVLDYQEPTFMNEMGNLLFHYIKNFQGSNTNFTLVSLNSTDVMDQDLLVVERLSCMILINKLQIQHIRLVLVNKLLDPIYCYTKYWGFICWALHYYIPENTGMKLSWNIADFFINDQLYSLFSSFAIGRLSVIIYKDIEEFLIDVEQYDIDLLLTKQEALFADMKHRIKGLRHVMYTGYFTDTVSHQGFVEFQTDENQKRIIKS